MARKLESRARVKRTFQNFSKIFMFLYRQILPLTLILTIPQGLHNTMTTEFNTIVSNVDLIDELIESVHTANEQKKVERSITAQNTLYMPVDTDLTNKAPNREISKFFIVRRIQHTNGNFSYAFAFDYWSQGEHLTREQVIERGYHVDNPFRGIRAMTDSDAKIRRVNSDGKVLSFTCSAKTLRAIEKQIANAEVFFSKANQWGMDTPDFRSSPRLKDMNMPHNCGYVRITKSVVTGNRVRPDAINFGDLSDSEFDALASAQ